MEIDRKGSTDTFRWSKDGGKSFVDEFVEIDESSQTLAHGLMVQFESSDGHALGDRSDLHCKSPKSGGKYFRPEWWIQLILMTRKK